MNMTGYEGRGSPKKRIDCVKNLKKKREYEHDGGQGRGAHLAWKKDREKIQSFL